MYSFPNLKFFCSVLSGRLKRHKNSGFMKALQFNLKGRATLGLDMTESFCENLFGKRLKFTLLSAMHFLFEDGEIVLQ